MVGEVAALMSIDKSTLLWENLEYARLQGRLLKSCNARLAKSMQINDQILSISIEEEFSAVNECQCKCAPNGFESSDSVSSSETYVEETALSVNNCEKEVRHWDGVECKSKGEAEEEEAVEGGKQNAHMTKEKVFEESASKGEQCQKKVSMFITNEGKKGQKVFEEFDFANHPTYVCDCFCDSLFVHDELAKPVVEVESNISQCKPNAASAQQGKFSTQCGADKEYEQAHLEEGDGGFTQVGRGPGFEEGIGIEESSIQEGVLVVRVLDEDRNEKDSLRIPDTPITESGLLSNMWEQQELQKSHIMHEVPKGFVKPRDACPSMNISLVLGDEEATVGNICKTPP